MLKIAILIPALNVCKQLAELVGELSRQYPDAKIIVVDDGSVDGTTDKLCHKFPQVSFLHHAENRGKGAALKTGLHFIFERLDVDAIVFMDGDGQHSPLALRNLIEKIDINSIENAFIIGRRTFSLHSMPWARIISNTMTSLLVSLKIHTRIHDSQSGFRLIDIQLLRKIMPVRANGYDFETELLLKAGKSKARFREVAIPTIYADEKSNIRPLRDIIRFLRTFLTT